MLFGEAPDIGGRLHPETNHNPLAGGSQENVAIVNRPDTGMPDRQPHLLGGNVPESLLQGRHAAVNIRLENHVEFRDFVRVAPENHFLQGSDLTRLQAALFEASLLCLRSDVVGALQTLQGVQLVPGRGHIVEAPHLDRQRRAGLSDSTTTVVEQGAHLAERRPTNNGITDMQGSFLHQDARDSSDSRLGLGLYHRTGRGQRRVGPQFQQAAQICEVLYQHLDTDAGDDGSGNHVDVSTPLAAGYKTVFR